MDSIAQDVVKLDGVGDCKGTGEGVKHEAVLFFFENAVSRNLTRFVRWFDCCVRTR